MIRQYLAAPLVIRQKKAIHNDNHEWIRDVVISADKTMIAGAKDNGFAKIWNVKGEELYSFGPFPVLAHRIAFNKNNQFFAVGCGYKEKTVCIYDLHKNGHQIFCAKDKHGLVGSLIFTPDNKYIIAGFESGIIKMWDIKTGKLHKSFERHKDIVTALVLGNNNQLISASGDGEIKIWDIEKGKFIDTILKTASTITDIVLTPNGEKLIISFKESRLIQIWNFKKKRGDRLNGEHKAPVLTLAISQDGRFLFSGGQDALIKVWDMHTLKCVLTLKGHKDAILSLDLSSDKSMLVSGSAFGFVRIWDIEYGVVLPMGILGNIFYKIKQLMPKR